MTDLTATQQRLFELLSAAAAANEPCPGLDGARHTLGVSWNTAKSALDKLESAGLIAIEQTKDGRRVVRIVSTGQRTKPALWSSTATVQAPSVGWPKLTGRPEEFSALLGKAGRFEDSRRAIADKGSHGMPPRQSIHSFGGVSDVYGSRGVRTGGGMQL